MSAYEEIYARAEAMDRQDPLASYRDEFYQKEDIIYLDGNSLGRLPLDSMTRIQKTLQDEWGQMLIRGWNEQWLAMQQETAGLIGRIIGASTDEVFVGDSTSINLYKLACSALNTVKDRRIILMDPLDFPTNLYVIRGIVKNQFPGHQIRLIEPISPLLPDPDRLIDTMDKHTALVILSHVNYRSAYLYDMARINERARQCGCLVIWDLSHSAGALPVNLETQSSMLAVGCTYKYLNGGPGSPAYLYVRKELISKLHQPVTAWFSHKTPFAFESEYREADGIMRFATGTPPILSMAGIPGGARTILKAGLENIRVKSLLQSSLLMEMIRDQLEPLGFICGTPSLEERRGSHVALIHKEAYRINRAMIEPVDGSKVIIPDFRPPDIIRLAITPLYTRFTELTEAVVRIRQIIETQEFKRFPYDISGVP